MIVYHLNGEIDREQWDNCIKNSKDCKPYAFSWYLDIMAPGWEALVDDDYDSVFPIPAYTRYGVKYTVTPPFVNQLGAFSPDKPVLTALTEFLDYMPQIFRMTDLYISQNIAYPGYKVTEKGNFELSLSPSYDKISENFSAECLQYISDGVKNRLELADDISPKELLALCRADKNFNMSGMKISDYERVEELMHYCLDNGKGKITGVRAAGKTLLYAIFLVHIRGSVTVLLEANTQSSVEKNMAYFVMNEVITEYSSSHARLDFAGTAWRTPGSVGEAFGGKYVPSYRIYRNNIFWPVRLMK